MMLMMNGKILITYFFIIFSYVHGILLSLKNIENENSTQLLFDSSRNQAFCFPHEEAMALMSSEMTHNWGYSTSWNYSIAIQKVGQVLCKHLGFDLFVRIVPVEIEENRNKILWAASCLGYESIITHCLYEEFDDPSLTCKIFVGLQCQSCNTLIKDFKTSETLVITSPGFPDLYNDGVICEWIIKRKRTSSFVVKLGYLSLPPRDVFGSCSNGFLEIRSKNNDTSSVHEHQILCGKTGDQIFIIKNSILSLRLISGIFYPRPYGVGGFNLTVNILVDRLTATEGNVVKTSKRSLIIVGIVFGVLVTVFILFLLAFLIKYLKNRNSCEKRQRKLAHALHDTPFVGFPVNAPLPAIPGKSRSSILSISPDERQNDKSFLGSGVYEKIGISGKSSAYLHLDEVRNNHAFEDVDDSCVPNSFTVPALVFTPYDDDSRSQPSDMPSCLSYGSDVDSVFTDTGMNSLNCRGGERNGTYTVVAKPNIIITEVSSLSGKEKHSSNPLSKSFWNKRKKEFLTLSHVSHVSQRRSSEPNVKREIQFM